MNDLNSVFMVGHVKKVDFKENVTTRMQKLQIILLNNYHSYSDEENKYVPEQGEYLVLMTTKEAKKWSGLVKIGSRIGVNGRLQAQGKKITIIAFTIQFLDAKS
jgi:hypothetical protein